MPVPPLAATSVPPRVSVPLEVIGPPVTVRPVVPPEPSTLVTVPLLVAAIEIEPPPLVMAIPVPAVIVAKVKPVPLPISKAPLDGLELLPVPPLPTANVPVMLVEG